MLYLLKVCIFQNIYTLYGIILDCTFRYFSENFSLNVLVHSGVFSRIPV